MSSVVIGVVPTLVRLTIEARDNEWQLVVTTSSSKRRTLSLGESLRDAIGTLYPEIMPVEPTPRDIGRWKGLSVVLGVIGRKLLLSCQQAATVMARRHNLITQVAVLIGAVVGLGAEWLFRPPADRKLFLAAFTMAWLAMGMVAIVTGEVSLELRSGPVKEWHGMPVRILGVIMSLAAVAMYSWFSSVG